MASLYSVVNMDIPAFMMVQGYPARARGMNVEGMRRRGYSKELIRTLREAYRVLYRRGLTVEEALAAMREQLPESPELTLFMDSIEASERGIVRER